MGRVGSSREFGDASGQLGFVPGQALGIPALPFSSATPLSSPLLRPEAGTPPSPSQGVPENSLHCGWDRDPSVERLEARPGDTAPPILKYHPTSCLLSRQGPSVQVRPLLRERLSGATGATGFPKATRVSDKPLWPSILGCQCGGQNPLSSCPCREVEETLLQRWGGV